MQQMVKNQVALVLAKRKSSKDDEKEPKPKKIFNVEKKKLDKIITKAAELLKKSKIKKEKLQKITSPPKKSKIKKEKLQKLTSPPKKNNSKKSEIKKEIKKEKLQKITPPKKKKS